MEEGLGVSAFHSANRLQREITWQHWKLVDCYQTTRFLSGAHWSPFQKDTTESVVPLATGREM